MPGFIGGNQQHFKTVTAVASRARCLTNTICGPCAMSSRAAEPLLRRYLPDAHRVFPAQPIRRNDIAGRQTVTHMKLCDTGATIQPFSG